MPTTDDALLPSDAATLLDLYRSMQRIRHFEESVRSMSQGGLVPGLVHLCAGQEATSVGTCSLLTRRDFIASHHRGHGHCIAKGGDIASLMSEILGRRSGMCGGRSGSMHVFDAEIGNLGTNGIVGGGIPLAAGAGLAARTLGTGAVAVAYFGDGACNQGLVPECMNMAMVWRLPVIFVCENNGFGEFTAIEDVTAGSLTARGDVFGMPSIEADGMDVLAVRAAFAPALARARAGEGPSFIVLNTYRFGGHHAGDKQDYKDQEEARLWRERDPILKLARHLLESGEADADQLATIEAEAIAEIRAAVTFAKTDPEPAIEELATHVFA